MRDKHTAQLLKAHWKNTWEYLQPSSYAVVSATSLCTRMQITGLPVHTGKGKKSPTRAEVD